ncbi:MAG: TOMM precursor leader peptide-binding protein [Myxococcales bacterium]|nr:TOMM precursor leader peptide-binding protein [Myxococcales bacterium]
MSATESDTDTDRAGATPRLQLRPGAQVFVVSADELQIVAVNHSTTFTSAPVVGIVQALIEALADAPTRGELGARVAEATGELGALVDYVAELMIGTGCVVSRGAEGPLAELDPRGEFYAALGLDPDAIREALAAALPIVVAPGPSAAQIKGALAAVGIEGAVIEAEVGAPCGQALDALRAALDDARGPIVAWDVPWRMPFARLLNGVAIERERPILFGVCEGAVGRLGPYVIPKNTPCLECVQTRVLANAGDDEIRIAESYRARLGDAVPPPLPAHPAFRAAIANLLAIELSQIVLMRPPVTLGGYVEYTYGGVGARRHPALKVPRCPACHPMRPQRLAWNARFPAPLVKSGSV